MITSGVPLSYTNEHTTEERFMLKMVKNKVEDGELGIFGAEKYFKGVIDEELIRTSSNTGVHYCSNQPQEKLDEPCPVPKPKTTSSVRSESSWNSRRGLLVSNGPNGNKHSKKTGVKSMLASLACNCSDKDSVKVTEAKQPVKGGVSSQQTKWSSKRADEDVNIRREGCFTFPVLNPSVAEVKHPGLPEVKCEREGKKSISLERKVTMLSWDGLTPPREEILDSSRNGPQNDTGSDGSSDLFEIESFSINENNLFLAGQAIENNMYAPSEASVDWSVVTASVADFSPHEDLVPTRNVKGNSGILSGCKSLKAVRVSGDERCLTSSGSKSEEVVSPAMREWSNRLNSATPVAKIQADTKLICAGSGLHTSRNGFGVGCPVTHVASSDHLYMKQC